MAQSPKKDEDYILAPNGMRIPKSAPKGEQKQTTGAAEQTAAKSWEDMPTWMKNSTSALTPGFVEAVGAALERAASMDRQSLAQQAKDAPAWMKNYTPDLKKLSGEQAAKPTQAKSWEDMPTWMKKSTSALTPEFVEAVGAALVGQGNVDPQSLKQQAEDAPAWMKNLTPDLKKLSGEQAKVDWQSIAQQAGDAPGWMKNLTPSLNNVDAVVALRERLEQAANVDRQSLARQAKALPDTMKNNIPTLKRLAAEAPDGGEKLMHQVDQYIERGLYRPMYEEHVKAAGLDRRTQRKALRAYDQYIQGGADSKRASIQLDVEMMKAAAQKSEINADLNVVWTEGMIQLQPLYTAVQQAAQTGDRAAYEDAKEQYAYAFALKKAKYEAEKAKAQSRVNAVDDRVKQAVSEAEDQISAFKASGDDDILTLEVPDSP
ncbi:MAG: hypothetical protein AAGU74_15225, partial [Bacillota bacterium]